MKQKWIINGKIVLPQGVVNGSLLIQDEKIAGIVSDGIEPTAESEVIDAGGKIIMPGMIDTHNHMSDPGPTSVREDWAHGTRSAASGGITTICDMPLPCEPATVNEDAFHLKNDIASKNAVVDYAFWGGINPKEEVISALPDMDRLGCIGYKGFMCFATSVYPQITDGYLVKGMREVRKFDGLIALHAENAEVAGMGCDEYSARGCTDEACFDDARPWWTEYEAVHRAVLFAKMTDSRLQICHLSTVQGAEFLQKVKAEGVRVSVETCPHYLIFDRNVLREKKSYAKCTPPFRSRENVDKLWDYIFNGTIDVIGSDHGPFSDEEKVMQNDFWKEYCGFGCNDVVMAALITEGIHRRGLKWEKLAALTSGNAARILGLKNKGKIIPGADADLIFIDPDAQWVYDGGKSFSKTKSVKGVYQGMELTGKVTDTYVRGHHVYGNGQILCESGTGHLIRPEWDKK